MTSYIRDPFQIRRLERLIKRPLTEAELEGMAPVRFRDANGQTKVEWVRKLNFRDFYTK
jgi:hypothetical protein